MGGAKGPRQSGAGMPFGGGPGFWKPIGSGSGPVPQDSVRRQGQPSDRSAGPARSQSGTNFMKRPVTYPGPTAGPARKYSPQGFRPATIPAGSVTEQQRLAINDPAFNARSSAPPKKSGPVAPGRARQFAYPAGGPPMRRPSVLGSDNDEDTLGGGRSGGMASFGGDPIGF